MKNCIGAIFIMMAGYAVSSELSEDDKRKVIDAVHIAVGTIQLIEGYDVSEEVTDEEAQLAEFANTVSWKATTPSGGGATIQFDSFLMTVAATTVALSSWLQIPPWFWEW